MVKVTQGGKEVDTEKFELSEAVVKLIMDLIS